MSDPPDVWHITNDNKVTLCGLTITWHDNYIPKNPDQWCEQCRELDG